MVLLLFVLGEDLNRSLFEGLLCYLEGDFLMRVIVTLMIIGDLTMDEGPLEEEDIMIGVEGCQIEGITMIEVTLEVDNPLMMEDPLMMVNCLMMEDPLMMENPLEMEEIQDALEDEDHQATRTSWTCKAYHSATAPGHTRHNSFREYFWNSWPVNVTIG